MESADTAAERLRQAAERLELASRNLATPANSNQSTVTLQAGGVGVWIAVTCCVVMLACNLFLVALYLNQQRQIDSMTEWLTATYMLAPSIKPKDYKGK